MAPHDRGLTNPSVFGTRCRAWAFCHEHPQPRPAVGQQLRPLVGQQLRPVVGQW
jgi:hypothetical protein